MSEWADDERTRALATDRDGWRERALCAEAEVARLDAEIADLVQARNAVRAEIRKRWMRENVSEWAKMSTAWRDNAEAQKLIDAVHEH